MDRRAERAGAGRGPREGRRDEGEEDGREAARAALTERCLRGPDEGLQCRAIRGRARARPARAGSGSLPPNHPIREATIAARDDRTRVNSHIRISPVRLIGADGDQVGIVPLDQAREAARQAGLDLVEVAATARPPVVRVMDWGKHQYEQQKAAREAKKRQHTVDVKEVKFRPLTDQHDFDIKVRNARRFLQKGKKVKVTVRYRGREMRRPELGRKVLDEVRSRLEDVAAVESRSDALEARQMGMTLAPARE
ncbi:MAG TPA: translation initiation factor IF-3 [Longimicrobiaceae bacterium]|nr:translation initiation factor IF-3 [Longimicrobiaceae bacterium]